MNRMKLHKKAMILLALILAMTLGSGCTSADWADLIDIGKSWAQANNVLDADGKPTWSTIGRVGLGMTTGDPGVDAVIDAGAVVDNFNKAEKLSEEGRQNHDVTLVDKAINLRPKDYSYRNQKGAMLFFVGDGTAAEEEYDSADDLSATVNSAAYVRNLETRVAYLMREKDYFRDQELVRANKITQEQENATMDRYFKRMAALYKELYETTGNVVYKESYEAFQNR